MQLTMACPKTDIKVKVLNNTGQSDFTIVVFAYNVSPNATSSPYVAWHTIRAQTRSEFTYPAAVRVGARYMDDKVLCQCSPFDAELGSTWSLIQETRYSTPVLVLDEEVPANPDGAIVIKNQKPKSWLGRPFTFIIFKDEEVLLMEDKVGIGCQSLFIVESLLYFGVVKGIRAGSVLQSTSTLQQYYKVDMKNYINGLVVTLDLDPSSGRYSFSADQAPQEPPQPA